MTVMRLTLKQRAFLEDIRDISRSPHMRYLMEEYQWALNAGLIEPNAFTLFRLTPAAHKLLEVPPTREDWILRTWEAHSRSVRPNSADHFTAALLKPRPVPDRPLAAQMTNEMETYETITFTFESVGYHHQGETYEWWNVICEGRIIDYIPYKRGY
ncbi:hypothetical protein [Rhizobium phage RHph_X2_24]|nr:hypothetical protein [Rhizobium phage RHph_X2_24]